MTSGFSFRLPSMVQENRPGQLLLRPLPRRINGHCVCSGRVTPILSRLARRFRSTFVHDHFVLEPRGGACTQPDTFRRIPCLSRGTSAPARLASTQKVAVLDKNVRVRAVEKVGDFLLLEADGVGGGLGGGKLGWCDASCVVPSEFPAIYEFGTDLPEHVSGRILRLARHFRRPKCC